MRGLGRSSCLDGLLQKAEPSLKGKPAPAHATKQKLRYWPCYKLLIVTEI